MLEIVLVRYSAHSRICQILFFLSASSLSTPRQCFSCGQRETRRPRRGMEVVNTYRPRPRKFSPEQRQRRCLVKVKRLCWHWLTYGRTASGAVAHRAALPDVPTTRPGQSRSSLRGGRAEGNSPNTGIC